MNRRDFLISGFLCSVAAIAGIDLAANETIEVLEYYGPPELMNEMSELYGASTLKTLEGLYYEEIKEGQPMTFTVRK